MGIRIQSYTLSELRRISIPGCAAPCLFWVVPIGKWPESHLNLLQEVFSRDRGVCAETGLLLVKNQPETGRESRLDGCRTGDGYFEAGQIQNLMPPNVDRFLSPSSDESQGMRLLILSGAYPQPGWGLLFDAVSAMNIPYHLNSLVERALEGLELEGDVRTIQEAATKFHCWKSCNEPKPPSDEFRVGEDLLTAALKALIALERVLSVKSSQKIVSSFDKLENLLSRLKTELTPGVNAATARAAVGRLSTYYELGGFLKGGSELDLNRLAAQVEAASFKNVPEVYKSLPDKTCREALRTFLHVRSQTPGLSANHCAAWIQGQAPKLLAAINQSLMHIRAELEARLAAVAGQEAVANAAYIQELETWKTESKSAEREYRIALGRSVNVQWIAGPKLLVGLERACKTSRIPVRSIPWDPARMVGWKLVVAKVPIEPKDVIMVSREFFSDDTGELNGPRLSATFNGSVFADYVHFISLANPKLSPRSATCRMLQRLMLPSRITPLLGINDNSASPTAEHLALCDQLVSAWGWEEEPVKENLPLAACLKRRKDGSVSLRADCKLNAIRCVIENYCKDLLQVTLAQLGQTGQAVFSMINTHCPSYVRTPDEKWAATLDKLTIGPAVILLKGLMPVAFPGMETSIKEVISDLEQLQNVLNPLCHDGPRQALKSRKDRDEATIISHLLSKTCDVVHEMPWHLKPSQRFGDQPTIVTGYAWSHSHAEERLIRVFLWSGEQIGREALVWNPELTNPIMTDAKIIEDELI